MTVTQVAITGSYVQTDTGDPSTGFVTIKATSLMFIADQDLVITDNKMIVPLVDGAFTVNVTAVDNDGSLPTGVSYRVEETIDGQREQPFWIFPLVADAVSGIDVSAVDRNYEPVVGLAKNVRSVNGIAPDGQGNVNITIAELGGMTQNDGDARYIQLGQAPEYDITNSIDVPGTVTAEQGLITNNGLSFNGDTTLTRPTAGEIATGGIFRGQNLAVGTDVDLGSGNGVLSLSEATTAPLTTPTTGGVIFVEDGQLKYIGPSGTITTLAT